MEAGFQSFDPQGRLLFDSNYHNFRLLSEGAVPVSMDGQNSMYVIPTSLNASGRTWTFSRLPIGCFITKMNVQRSGVTQAQCFNSETLALGSGAGFGPCNWQNFVRGAVASGNTGMQTFNQAGELTFDSSARQLVFQQMCYPDVFTLTQVKQNPVDPAYTDYYYSAPVVADMFYIVEEPRIDLFNVTPVRVGFRPAYGSGLLFAAYSTRNGAGPPACPTVAIGVATSA